ncbi:MAG: hypothetical protein ACSNEK_00175 [Parachlamydiaceae bacterium]
MTKKNFSKGIHAILGDDEDSIRKPKASIKNDDTSSRTTIFLDTATHETLKAIAYWERRSLTSVIKESLQAYIENKGTKYIEEAEKSYLLSMDKKL